MAQLHYLIIYGIQFLPFVFIFFQRKVLNFSIFQHLKYRTVRKFLSYIKQKFFCQLTPVLVAWGGVYFSWGLVISALFWLGKRNFDGFWPSFKNLTKFDRSPNWLPITRTASPTVYSQDWPFYGKFRLE